MRDSNRLLGGARPADCAVPPHAHNRVPANLIQGRDDPIVTLGSIGATPASASLRAAREADASVCLDMQARLTSLRSSSYGGPP